MLQSAIAEEKSASASPSKSTPAVDDSALEWTTAWSNRLAQLDIEKIMSTAGVALDQHVKAISEKKKSKLDNWQEIDVPSYAPLIFGGAADVLAATTAATQPPTATPSAATPVESEAASLARRAQEGFQPDAVVHPKADTIETL